MKRISLILSFVLLTFSISAFAQSSAEIASIRNGVAAINKSARRYKKTEKYVDGISLEGTQATYFTSGRGLHKITAQIAGETFYATVELYYQGEQLIFAYEKFSRYKSQVGIPGGTKVVSVQDKRFYFSDEKLIRYLIGKASIKSTDERYAADGDSIKETAKKLKEAYLQSLN